MLQDKSRLILFGALALLFITLLSGNISFHPFYFSFDGSVGLHGHGLTKVILIGFAIWLLMGRGGCCRYRCGSGDDGAANSASDGAADAAADTASDAASDTAADDDTSK